jgi:hypothetical protein
MTVIELNRLRLQTGLELYLWMDVTHCLSHNACRAFQNHLLILL